MAKKRKTKKPAVKRSNKRSIPAVDFFTSDVSDEALERVGLRNVRFETCGGGGGATAACVLLAVGSLRMVIPLTPNKKA